MRKIAKLAAVLLICVSIHLITSTYIVVSLPGHNLGQPLYRDAGGNREMIGEYPVYLPVLFRPYNYLVVASFDNCAPTNDLGGQMGAAYSGSDRLWERYVPESGRGCVAELEYRIQYWAAFWMKLQRADLATYSKLCFDTRAAEQGRPAQIKVELQRANEVSTARVGGITTDWQTLCVNLADFGPTGYAPPLSSFDDMEELIFTFETPYAGKNGTAYLDNVTVWE